MLHLNPARVIHDHHTYNNKKVKFFLSRHEGEQGEMSYNSTHSYRRHYMEPNG
jgi:hypothetical protein